MFSIIELNAFLKNNNGDFEILAHDSPIVSIQDAAKYFDIKKAASTLIMNTEQGLIAFIVSARRGKLDLKTINKGLGFSKLKMADKEKTKQVTGYDIGAIPLIGHNLPCVFDRCLLENDYIYGGSGDKFYTLKITPDDVFRLNNVIRNMQ